MTFREFWPLYLQAHANPTTRAVHYGATIIGVGSAIAAAATGSLLLLLGIAVAYTLAIGSHAMIEKNRSMIRVNPVWGAVADLRMFWLAITGSLAHEIKKNESLSRRRRIGKRHAQAAPRSARRCAPRSAH